MVTIVLGPSGSGKTRWLIEQANKEKQQGNGNIVFIDSDDGHIFSLDHKVRLINAKDFSIDTEERLYGFLSGIISRDYDIEKIYVDGIYEIIDFHDEPFEDLIKNLNELGDKYNVEVLMGMDKELDELPEACRESVVELTPEN